MYYNKRQYKIRWDDGSRTWVFEANLRADGCGNLVDDYNRASRENEWVPDCSQENEQMEEERRYERKRCGRRDSKRRRRFNRKISKEIAELVAREDWVHFPGKVEEEEMEEEMFEDDLSAIPPGLTVEAVDAYINQVLGL
jgi:hypothetical protein